LLQPVFAPGAEYDTPAFVHRAACGLRSDAR
jgi:hypothetical protein